MTLCHHARLTPPATPGPFLVNPAENHTQHKPEQTPARHAPQHPQVTPVLSTAHHGDTASGGSRVYKPGGRGVAVTPRERPGPGSFLIHLDPLGPQTRSGNVQPHDPPPLPRREGTAPWLVSRDLGKDPCPKAEGQEGQPADPHASLSRSMYCILFFN